MVQLTTPLDNYTLDITIETRVHASLEDTFAALLEEMGPQNTGMGNAPMPMVLEARPGGRWYRDLGNDNGHCWGTVQAIRVPTLLEISGPLMMSFAVASNIQYRLRADGDDTVMTFRHNALGLFPEGYRDALGQGWTRIAQSVQQRFPATA
ncbi:MAG: SRPBCC domain-containing protein [Gemmatimonadetes bacterium]|nr:SRPBCC domain-containing protein [Gemmatimonadota bacterium]